MDPRPQPNTPTLKRRADDQPSSTPPSKRRLHSVAALDSSMRLIRRTPSGKDILIEQCLDLPSEDEEEPVFEDALEEMDGLEAADHSSSHGRANEEDHKADDDEDEQDSGKTGKTSVDAEPSHVATSGNGDEKDAEEDDLFAATFDTKHVRHRTSVENQDDNSDIIEIIDERPTTNAFDALEHTKGCTTTSRSASTPPPLKTKSTSKPITSQIPSTLPERKPADLKKDLAPALVTHRKLHERAVPLKPRLPLASHRYWIGVLHPERRNLASINSEKNFTWMKGNRLTTMRTIWHAYATATFTAGFVLMCRGEVVYRGEGKGGKEIKAEEVDFFRDQLVVLRAVKDENVREKEFAEGCPAKEVVECVVID